MELFTEPIKTALTMYRNRNAYCYLYGAKGAVLRTRQDVLNFFAAEPGYFAKYSNDEKEQIIRNSVGKIAFDCSGFTGHCTGDKVWSTGQISNCSLITTPRDGVAGSLLYTTFGGKGRHIGLDIGYGFCLDMGYESTDAAVREGRDSVRLTRISETAWEKSGRSRVLDYTGASNL